MGQPDSVISFDNAQVFDSANIVLDDFNDNVKTAWTDTLNGGTVSEANMQFELKTAPVNITAFTATRKTTQTFQIQDGGRVEFSIDVINNVAADVHRFAVLGYLPAASGVSSFGLRMRKGSAGFSRSSRQPAQGQWLRRCRQV